VHELGGGAASVGFGYRIMALRKRYESVRSPTTPTMLFHSRHK
jgi:hypothetical protein